jgi:glycosyltransferase involved in cell wall biosynthesis
MEGINILKVAVVNNVSNVFTDVYPFLKDQFDINLINRTRGLLDKTIGIFLKIRNSDDDLYHVNYALQDAYIVHKIRRLDILHCHGSDVRWTINSRKWGWMVKKNLKNARKVVYSTPDLLEYIIPYREDVSYIPNPVNTDTFKKVNNSNRNPINLKALYIKKWYEEIPNEVVTGLSKNSVSLDILKEKIGYEKMPYLLNMYDFYVDRFTIHSLSKTALEAMACELPIINYSNLTDVNEYIADLKETKIREIIGIKNREIILQKHDRKIIAEKISNMWYEMK